MRQTPPPKQDITHDCSTCNINVSSPIWPMSSASMRVAGSVSRCSGSLLMAGSAASTWSGSPSPSHAAPLSSTSSPTHHRILCQHCVEPSSDSFRQPRTRTRAHTDTHRDTTTTTPAPSSHKALPPVHQPTLLPQPLRAGTTPRAGAVAQPAGDSPPYFTVLTESTSQSWASSRGGAALAAPAAPSFRRAWPHRA